jgi:hypothetical protein
VASALIIALCSDIGLSFDGEWKAAAVCAVALAVEFSALLWQERRQRSLVGRGLLVLIATAGLGAMGLAVYAGLHANVDLSCLGGGAPPPPVLSPAEEAAMRQAEAVSQTLYIVDTLVAFAYLATLSLALMGAVFVTAKRRAVRRLRAR